MKKTLLLITALAGTISGFAQTQIGNSDMELWDNATNSSAEPVNWNSFKTASGGLALSAQQAVWRSTNVRPGAVGAYCAQIKCISIFSIPANGNMTLGQVNMGNASATSASNYNWSKTSDADFSEALTDTPDSIVFWVKFTPLNASHEARMSVALHDTYNYIDGYNVDAGSAPHKVAEAQLNYGTTNGQWVRKSVPFVYTGPASANTFILATFATNKTPGVGTVGDEVLLDDVQLIYNPVNQAVVANDDAITTPEDQAVAITVAANDVDPENDFDLTSVSVTVAPTNGSTSVNPTTGVITYTPNAGWFGTDVFTYSICDNGMPVLCDQAVVTVTVTEVIVGNNQIIANDDVAVTNMNTPVVTNVLANDVDVENQINNSTLNVTVNPTNGTTSVNTTTGEITYTPATGYYGNDSYTYAICDAGTPAITCDTAVVNVTVNINWGINEADASLIQVTVEEQVIHILGEELTGTYAIYASNGQLVQNGDLTATIQTHQLKGIYFLTIQSNKGNTTKKISILY
jgi:hypothetical protein